MFANVSTTHRLPFLERSGWPTPAARNLPGPEMNFALLQIAKKIARLLFIF
jgi:hypothetical protein